jgi:phosphate:Na+ symporter
LTALVGEMGLVPGRGESQWLQPLRSGAVIVGGFALILIGIGIMQSIAPAVQSSGLFRVFLSNAEESVLWGLAAGIVLSAAVHSSAAVIGIIMGLASVGAMPVEIGIAIVLGANVGTCVTALLASLGATKSGRFVAWSHVILNVGGAVLFIPFVTELQHVSAWISVSPSSQIAHAQTIFNILSSLIALPFCYLPALRRLSPD